MRKTLDQWVNDNNPPERAEYAKGFWDLVELARRMRDTFEAKGAFVVGTHVVHTPPPEEELVVPIVRLEFDGARFVLEHDFARWPHEWRVGVRLDKPYRGPLLALFDPAVGVAGKQEAVEELAAPPYSVDQQAFACRLQDEWEVVTLMRLVLRQC